MRIIPVSDRPAVVALRQGLANSLRSHWLIRYERYCAGQEDLSGRWPNHAAEVMEEIVHLLPAEVPLPVVSAAAFYRDRLETGDWGSVKVWRWVRPSGSLPAHEPPLTWPIYLVDVATDGDDGWLEVYDARGELLGAARRYIELLAWEAVDGARSRLATHDFPPDLNLEATLWQG